MTGSARVPVRRRVAMLMWGDVVEDFLDTLGWSLDDLLARMTGGWFFGYVDALARSGVDAVPIFFTRRRTGPREAVHVPSGARVRLIPSPTSYRLLRSAIRTPYDGLYHGDYYAGHIPRPLRPLHAMARDVLPYLATPQAALSRVIAEEQCHAILCQEYEEPRFDVAVRCGRERGIPVFATFQGAAGWRSRREAEERPRAIEGAAGFIIGSSRERARVQERYGVPDERIRAIHNPLDDRLWFPEPLPTTREALGIPGHATVVAWHGRVEIFLKGLDVLLEAWRTVRSDATVPKHLLLIGSGSDAAELRRRLEEQGPDITWVDRYVADRAEMRGYLSCADLYVLPSRREGFPVAPLEAMACGLPVIASDVDGVAEIMPRGEADGGLVYPVGDTAALAMHLAALLGDPVRRRAMAAHAVRRVNEAFHPLVVGRQLADFLFAGQQ